MGTGEFNAGDSSSGKNNESRNTSGRLMLRIYRKDLHKYCMEFPNTHRLKNCLPSIRGA